jgi:hypothetical protein
MQRKAAAALKRPSSLSLELAADVGEGAAQVRANGGHGCDRRDSDQRSDQTVLNGRGTALIAQELLQHRHVRLYPCGGLGT